MISLKENMKNTVLFSVFVMLNIAASAISYGQEWSLRTQYDEFYRDINSLPISNEPDSLQRIQWAIKSVRKYRDSTMSDLLNKIEYDTLGRKVKQTRKIIADNGSTFWREKTYIWGTDGLPKSSEFCEYFDGDIKELSCREVRGFVFDSTRKLISRSYTAVESGNILTYHYYYTNNVLDSVIASYVGLGILYSKQQFSSYKLSKSNQLVYSKSMCINFFDKIDTSYLVETFDTLSNKLTFTDYNSHFVKLSSETSSYDTTNNIIQYSRQDDSGLYFEKLYIMLDSNKRKVYSLNYSDNEFITRYFLYNKHDLLEKIILNDIGFYNEIREVNYFYFQYEYY